MGIGADRTVLTWRAGLIGTALVLAGAAPVSAAAPAPPLVEPLAPYADCGLVIEDSRVYIPALGGFDPTDLARLLPLAPADRAVTAVLCRRNSVLPSRFDYRILTEMNLPLFIKDDERIALVEADRDQLTLALVAGPKLSTGQLRQVVDRLNQQVGDYRSGRDAAEGDQASLRVDRAAAYAPADLALLADLVGKSGVPQNLGGLALDAALRKKAFDGCPLGAQQRFTKTLSARLEAAAPEIRMTMAAQFTPPFTHDELVTLTRFIELSPITINTDAKAQTREPPKKTPALKAEIETLGKSPSVTRYIAATAPAMVPALKRVFELGTIGLAEVCPAKAKITLGNPGGRLNIVKYHPFVAFHPQSWTITRAEGP